MDIMVIISGIATIASLMAIFFDISDKIPITKKGFMLLVSVVCLVFFSITSFKGKNNSGDSQGDSTPIVIRDNPGSEDFQGDSTSIVIENDSGSEGLKNEDENSINNSKGSPNVTNKNEGKEIQSKPIDEDKENEGSKEILGINPIISSVHDVDAVKVSSYEIQPNNIIEFEGEITNDGQSKDYEYIPPLSGAYRFEFSNVPNGTDLRLRLYNSGWEPIKSDYDLDNGDGLTQVLTAGEKYYIRVEQYEGYGAYTLNIGQKKEIVDITNFTAVSDSIQYTNQENDYLYIAGNDGTYRFDFSGVPNGMDLRLRIYNSGWEPIKSDYDLDNGEGLTVSFVSGEIYYIRVEQYREIGSYILNIGPKKEILDVTNYTAVSDSIQYTAQENDYSYVAENDGAYRFEPISSSLTQK